MDICKHFFLGIKKVLYLKYIRINGLVGVKMEKRNSQLEHGQPMEQTRGLVCTCDTGVTRCHSQHKYHFWRMSKLFEEYCTGKLAWQLSIKFV